MNDGLLLSLAFFSSALIAPRVVDFCRKRGLVDAVNHRSAHDTPRPRGGGLGVVLVATLFAIAAIQTGEYAFASFWWAVFACGALIAAIGWQDDKYNVPARWRFLGQIVAVSTALYFLPPFLADDMPIWAEKALLGIAWLWFINLYNFMDGLDGFATTEAVIIALGLAFMAKTAVGGIAVVVAGACMGFLRVNWPRAWIFLGDTGSTWLGFVLGGMLIGVAASGIFYSGTWNLFWAGLTLSSLFWADATYTLLRRLVQGEKVWQAHRSHWYQRAFNMGMSHAQILLRALGLNLCLLVLALVAAVSPYGPQVLAIALTMLTLVAMRIRYLEGK